MDAYYRIGTDYDSYPESSYLKRMVESRFLACIGKSDHGRSIFSFRPFLFRYLSPVIPFLSILSALIIYAAFKVQRLFGFLIITLLIWMQPLHDFYFELTHDYQGPMKGIAHYLNQHAAQNDIVLITYGDLTLKFYTKLRILGGYTGENLEPARNANWIVIREKARIHIISEPFKAKIRL